MQLPGTPSLSQITISRGLVQCSATFFFIYGTPNLTMTCEDTPQNFALLEGGTKQ
jgi:hypothetical protein